MLIYFFNTHKTVIFKYLKAMNAMNTSDNYWHQFPPIESHWHYINAIILSLIGLTSIVTNLIVLRHLYRFEINLKD